MRNLITGVGGFIGSFLLESLMQDGEEVLGMYYKPTIDMNEIQGDIELLECDIRNQEIVFDIIYKYMPDRIYHLAAQSSVVKSWKNPSETIDINICGTINIFESIKKIRKYDKNYNPLVLVACSSAEYGEVFNGCEKIKENVELKPLSPYGVSKVGQDLISYQYFINEHINCIRARILNTTGPRKKNDVTSDFIRSAMFQKKNNISPIVLEVGNIDTYRAILDYRDTVNALKLLMEEGKEGEEYNISARNVYQIKDIINIIEYYLGENIKIIKEKKLLRPSDEYIIYGDITKISKDTLWKQKISLEQTIKEMIDYWRKK